MIDPGDIGDHPIEIAAHPIDAVRLGARAVDRAGHFPKSVLHERLENIIGHAVQVHTIERRERHVARVRDLQALQELRVEEDLAVVREFDVLNRRVAFETP
jgi:hypothetical protein